MFPDLEFHHIRAFLAVARTGNFTKAAGELGLSQSALSRSVQKLELQVGKPLFERHPRSVSLSAVGEIFYPRAVEILRLVEDSFREISEIGEGGQIRLGTIPTIAPYFLPQALRDFSTQSPDIKVAVFEGPSEMLIKKCALGEIDAAILALPFDVENFAVTELFTEELYLVMPSNHALARQNEIAISDVQDIPFVMLGEGHCLSDQVESFCQRQEVQPISIERTSQITTVQELVSLEHGVSIVPHMAKVMDQSDRRTYRSFAEPKPTRTIAVITNPKRHQSAALRGFVDFLESGD